MVLVVPGREVLKDCAAFEDSLSAIVIGIGIHDGRDAAIC